jgi:pheromone shutdown-related protein TraB
MKPKIIIVPTSHIAKESVKKIKEVIEEEKPDCVAVELDTNRYYAVKHKRGSSFEAIKSIGFFTFIIYFILKKVQDSLGRKTGIFPGSDMLKAIEIARKNNIDIAFIDRDITETMMAIKQIPLKEKVKLIFFSVFGSLNISRRRTEIDLNQVPPKDLIREVVEEFKKEFPSLYKILVAERNKYMVNNLKHLSQRFKKIVVVVGAGHAEDIKNLLK